MLTFVTKKSLSWYSPKRLRSSMSRTCLESCKLSWKSRLLNSLLIILCKASISRSLVLIGIAFDEHSKIAERNTITTHIFNSGNIFERSVKIKTSEFFFLKVWYFNANFFFFFLLVSSVFIMLISIRPALDKILSQNVPRMYSNKSFIIILYRKKNCMYNIRAWQPVTAKVVDRVGAKR